MNNNRYFNKKVYLKIIVTMLIIQLISYYSFVTQRITENISILSFIRFMNNNYFTIVFFYSLLIIFFIMHSYSSKEFLNYHIFRYKSINNWFLNEIKFIVSFISKFTFLIYLIQILISLSLIKYFSFEELLPVILNSILIYIYLLAIGLLTFICCLKLKNKFWIVIFSNLFGLISIAYYYTCNTFLHFFSVQKNILITSITNFIPSFFFWVFIVLSMYFLIKYIIFKKYDIYIEKDADVI